MFHVLLESRAERPPRGPWTLTSTVLHAALITGAVALTLRDVMPTPDAPEVVSLVLPRQLASAPRTATPPRVAAPTSLTFRQIQVTVPAITAPEVSPRQLPVVGDSIGGAGMPNLFPSAPAVGDSVYRPHFVERQVLPRADNPRPVYPPSLRAAMVEGSVVVQFVVDTTGRVEPQSISILHSTHEQFSHSARQWLTRTRYAPAEIRGRPVRQLVQQEVAFTLER
ncbi:MAG: TonB family protein [Gemmatimonadaceae bacterium]